MAPVMMMVLVMLVMVMLVMLSPSARMAVKVTTSQLANEVVHK